ncbi:putative Ig domain-containing protein [Candidatus Daviesbacteria bacterium]|nr:putative Ig domain-containing protein [Candidatus Daviesbacteria bacterium]
MNDLVSFLKTRRNLVNLLVLVVIILGLPIGIALVKQQQILFSRAQVGYIKFKEGACVTTRNNQLVATCIDPVTVEAVSPIGPPGTPEPSPTPPASCGSIGNCDTPTPTPTATPTPPPVQCKKDKDCQPGFTCQDIVNKVGVCKQSSTPPPGTGQKCQKTKDCQPGFTCQDIVNKVGVCKQSFTPTPKPTDKNKNGALLPDFNLVGNVLAQESCNENGCQDLPQYCQDGVTRQCTGGYCDDSETCQRSCDVVDGDPLNCGGGGGNCNPAPGTYHVCGNEQTAQSACGNTDPTHQYRIYKNNACNWESCRDEGANANCGGGGGQCGNDGDSYTECSGNPATYCYTKGGNFSQAGYVIDVQKKTDSCSEPYECSNPRQVNGFCGYSSGGSCSDQGLHKVCGDEFAAREICTNPQADHQYRVFRSSSGGTCHWEQGSCQDLGVNTACNGSQGTPTPTPTSSGKKGTGSPGSGDTNKKCNLSFDPNPLPNGAVGAPYNARVKLSNCGGVSGVVPSTNTTLSVTGGVLPPGISLDDSLDLIKGTPSNTGTYQFTVSASKDKKKDTTETLASIAGSITISGGGGGETGEKTSFYKFSETPEGLSSALQIPYSDEPVLINFKFANDTPGDKFIFIEFVGSKGTVQRKSASIKLVEPDPQVTSKNCSTSLGDDGVRFHLSGRHFGSQGSLRVADSLDAQVNNWDDHNIDALLKFSLNNLRDVIDFPLTVKRSDGVETETVCTIGQLEQLELGTKLFCRQPSDHTQNNVEVIISQQPEASESASSISNPRRETTSIDRLGRVQGLQTRFEIGKAYNVWVKAPGSLRRMFTFIAAAGVNVIPDMILPVGDIFPLSGGDGVINSADKAELNREWGESRSASAARNGDFNRDTKVNSFDWACMRYDFGQRDEPEP